MYRKLSTYFAQQYYKAVRETRSKVLTAYRKCRVTINLTSKEGPYYETVMTDRKQNRKFRVRNLVPGKEPFQPLRLSEFQTLAVFVPRLETLRKTRTFSAFEFLTRKVNSEIPDVYRARRGSDRRHFALVSRA